MSRSDSAQGTPPADLSEFPRSEFSGGAVLYRSTRAPNGFGWFSSTGDGRFDLAPPRGTLYVGMSAHCAVMERVAAPQQSAPDSDGRVRNAGRLLQDGKVAEEEADRILVWTLIVAEPFDAANLTDEAAGRDFEVTNELSAGSGSYALPQLWAQTFDAQALGAIEYRSRFVTADGSAEHAVAVFGSEGEGGGPFTAAGEPRTLTDASADARVPIRRKPAAITNVVDAV